MNGKRSSNHPVIFFCLREKALFYLSFILILLILFSPQTISSQSDANSLPGEIQWKTSVPAVSSVSGEKLDTILDKGPGRHIVIQFEKPITEETWENLKSSGISLLSYLGNNGWFANVSGKPGVAEAARKQGVMKASEIRTEWKLDPAINSGNIPLYALFRSDNINTPLMEDSEDADTAVLYVVFHPDVNLEPDGIEILDRHCCTIQDLLPPVNAACALVPLDGIRDLADEDAVQWIEVTNPPLTETNDSNRAITQVDDVQGSPYNLNGSGIDVLVYDSGQVGNHLDFGTRLTHGDADTVSDHSTHVAGTVGGSGANSINKGGTANQWKGMAPGVDIISYGTEWTGSGYIFYNRAPDLAADYTAAIGTYGADIANNSLGSNVYSNYYPTGCVIVGKYGVSSVLIDGIVRGSLGSPFRVVWAAGNERGWDTTCYGRSYWTISPPAAAKNSIVVGGVNSNNDTQYAHSSWGPTEDGRTKPDICGPACQTSGDYGVKSTDNDPVNSYTVKCGTSMAAPTVTGICALIMQDWKVQLSTSVLPSNSMLKVLLAHNAQDRGNAGPDFQYGYGSVRAKDTIDFMRTERFAEYSLSQGAIREYFLVIPSGTSELKATMAWDDPPGTYNCNPALINNLDLMAKAPDGTVWRPFILNPANPANTATRGVDNRNNLEQVLVPNPDAGVWSIRVYGTVIPSGSQLFSLAMSHNYDLKSPGSISLDEISYEDTQRVYITVFDPDRNQNKSASESINVDIVSDTESAGETVTLNETGADTGEFYGWIDLSPTDTSGKLLVTPGDKIMAEYEDVYSQGLPSRTLYISAIVIAPDVTLVVDTLDDYVDWELDPFHLSLRMAIEAIPDDLEITTAPPSGPTITFDPALFTPTGTITLNNSLGELLIDKDMNIQGPGADILSIDGNASQRVFHISAGNVHLYGVTVTNGYEENGGGIWVEFDANVAIDSCAVSDNTADENGGGILNQSMLEIHNSTISGNSVILNSPSTSGGGIHNSDELKMTNCTVSGNSSSYNEAGGIANDTGTLEITNCTVSKNSAPDVGGVFNTAGIAYVNNSIIAGNLSTLSNLDVLGDFTSNGYNIIGYPEGSAGWLPSDITNIAASQAIDTILQDNGEPTKTHAVILCGPAFDGGNDDEVTTPTFLPPPYTDQRGMPRISHTAVDIGAFEFQPGEPAIEVSPPSLDFGIHFLNQGPSAPQSITITNSGTADLAFNSFDFSPDFHFAPDQDTSDLGVCMSRTLDIVFDPSSLGFITGTLDIHTNDPITPTVTIDLQGTGFNLPPMAAACEADNISLDFQQTYDRVFMRSYYDFPTTEYTVSFWMNCDDLTRDSSIFSYAVPGRDNELLLYFYLNQLQIIHKGTNINTGMEFKDGLWHHLAVTWRSSDGQIKIYKDGQDVFTGSIGMFSSLTINGTIVLGDDQDCVGGCFQSSQSYIGLLDEMRIWNVVRSKDDIQQDMIRTLEGDEPGLVGYWKCDEGGGTVIYDLSPYGYNGTLSGYPDWSVNAPDLIYYDNFITVDENTDSTVTLCGIDPDADPLTGIITQLPDPGIGELYQFAGEGPVRGAIIDSVPAIVADPMMRVVYVPVDTTINYQEYMKYKVNDGYEDSSNEASYTFIVLDNDPPLLINNVPQSLAKGDSMFYTSDTLYATDFEDRPGNILYTLTNPPMHGTLWINGTDLEQDDIFSQADIDAGMLSYVHSSIGMAQEVFNFTLTDSANLVTGPYTATIDIIFTPAPQVYVDLNSPGPVLDGGSWSSAHHSVRIGVLDAEALGLNEVWVADGAYMEEVDMRSYTQALAGFEGYGGAEETMTSQRDWIDNICIVEGPEHRRAFTIDDITSSVVHGFVVTGSGISSNGADGDNLVTRCIIRENSAQSGGGIFMNGSAVQITECTIVDNEATREGGGIYMRNNSQPLIKNCVISGNTAEEEGGAFYCRNKEEPRIVNCIIAGNAATHGGAMYVRQNSSPLLVNCTVSGNSASTAGGGVFCDNDGAPIAINTIFEDNDSFAVYEGDDKANASVMNCLFWENPDGAFYNSDGAEYMDNEMADLNNDIPEAEGNIMGDPWFVDKPMGDFHLRACSAALDEGIPNQAPLDDKDGNIRPYDLPGIGIDGLGEGFDIGAYELYTTGTKILVTPVLLEFGNKLVNQGATDPQTVTILNEGIEILEIDSIEITGSDAYSLTTPPDETDMEICEQRELEVVFDPSEIGPTTGTLVIRSSDPNHPEVIVTLTGTGINTPPVAGLPVPGGDQFAMTTDEDTAKVIILSGYDVDGDDITAWVSQIPDLGKGAIHQYQGPGPIPGARITSVPTEVTDPDWRLVYVPDGASSQYTAIMKWKMNDGYADSLNRGTFTITVLADDDPAVLVNSTMTIVEGATEVVTPANLLATGDYPISYRIDSFPSFGEIQLNSAPLAINDIFMQDDIALGFVAYAHDGSEEASDAFGFSFKDMNSDWITTNTFTITVRPVNDPPVLAWNRLLHVDEGGIGAIMQIHLLVEDPDNTPAEIIYTVGTFPVNGDIYLDGLLMSSDGIETFTQADIDAGLLSYMHGGGNMDPDEFTFTFTDGEYNLGPETFAINISFPDRKGAWWMMR